MEDNMAFLARTAKRPTTFTIDTIPHHREGKRRSVGRMTDVVLQRLTQVGVAPSAHCCRAGSRLQSLPVPQDDNQRRQTILL